MDDKWIPVADNDFDMDPESFINMWNNKFSLGPTRLEDAASEFYIDPPKPRRITYKNLPWTEWHKIGSVPGTRRASIASSADLDRYEQHYLPEAYKHHKIHSRRSSFDANTTLRKTPPTSGWSTPKFNQPRFGPQHFPLYTNDEPESFNLDDQSDEAVSSDEAESEWFPSSG